MHLVEPRKYSEWSTSAELGGVQGWDNPKEDPNSTIILFFTSKVYAVFSCYTPLLALIFID